MPSRARHLLPATGLVALLLAGCTPSTPAEVAASSVPGATADGSAGTEARSDAATHPLTLDNCGTQVSVPEPPERIVAIKSTAIEMLLALGVGDRIVGTGFPDGPVPEELADAAADLPQLSDRVPSAEVVLETEPDLVHAGWESNLTGEGAGERETLAALGIATYVSPAACKDPAYQPDRLRFEDVFAEITEVGALLGVSDAAAELVADQEERLAAVEPDDRGLTALWYSSGTDVPYVGAGIGAPQMIMDAMGLENIAADVTDTWSPYGWETVADVDPDVIVLVDSSWNTAEAKKELLATSPATANLTAVREERYLVVPFAATEAGVRNVAAVEDLARQLAALG